KESGAYTGEISPVMLRDAGCDYVIIGHSERRGRFGVPEKDVPPEALTVFGDSDAAVGLKMRAALAHGLTPIFCCGETFSERQLGWTDEVVAAQLARGLADMDPDAAARLVIAYEPVWAIGTGEVCAAAESNRICGMMRRFLRRFFDRAADEIRIQYGGS